jgi:hypothetical protein
VLFQAGLVDRRRRASGVIYSMKDGGLLEWCRFPGTSKLPRSLAGG